MRAIFSSGKWVWFLLAVCVPFLMIGCARIHHTQKTFEGEVFLTPPPAGVASESLISFRVTDSYIRFLESFSIYRYSFDECMTVVNPMRFTVYNLQLGETFEWWEWFLLIADLASDFGAPDSRTVALEGKILVPESQKDWRPKPQTPFIGPTVFETE